MFKRTYSLLLVSFRGAGRRAAASGQTRCRDGDAILGTPLDDSGAPASPGTRLYRGRTYSTQTICRCFGWHDRIDAGSKSQYLALGNIKLPPMLIATRRPTRRSRPTRH